MASFISGVGKVTVSLLRSTVLSGIVLFFLCPSKGDRISLMGIDSEVLHHVLIQLKPQSRTVGHLDKAVYINLHCWG